MYLGIHNRHLIMGDWDHVDWWVVDHTFPWYPQWFDFCPYEQTFETELDGQPVYAAVQPNIKLRNNMEIMNYAPGETQEDLDKGIFRIQYEFKNW